MNMLFIFAPLSNFEPYWFYVFSLSKIKMNDPLNKRSLKIAVTLAIPKVFFIIERSAF